MFVWPLRSEHFSGETLTLTFLTKKTIYEWATNNLKQIFIVLLEDITQVLFLLQVM